MTGISIDMRRRSRLFGSRTGILVCSSSLLFSGIAFAAPQVSGTPQALRIEAQNTSIKDVLAALNREFHVAVATSTNLDREITGTYQGSLQRVLDRILEGYNFVVKSAGGHFEVTVLGTRDGKSTSVAAAAPVVAKTAQASVAKPQSAASPPPALAPAKAAEGPQPSKSQSPGPVPEIKIADGAAPMPTPTPSTVEPPTGGTNGPIPELQPSSVAPPTPTNSASLDAPVPGPVPGAGGLGAPEIPKAPVKQD